MPIVRWGPFRDSIATQDRMNRLFNETPGGFLGEEEGVSTGNWIPPVDIYETDHDIVLKAELPGVDSKDVEASMHDGKLYLKGERKYESDVKEESYLHVERAYGGFARTFTLPASVDAEKVKAEFKDGILTLTMPKREEAKPRKIKISM
ncbi:MAG TPA: Hsp20/alpha crystallin family protein [Terriglobia bacterium]|nr:Hsp20/alpha crystallin family protein [Terriglobia bacterium]